MKLFENIIREHVENVYYLPYDERTGLDSIYAHDSLKVTKKGAIYFPMGKALRSKGASCDGRISESAWRADAGLY